MSDEANKERVLLSAYACSPYRGGEPGLGWARVYLTAQKYDTWVICKEGRYADDVRRYFEENGDIPTLHFHFLPRTGLEKLIRQTPGFFYLAYHLWHRRAFKLAQELDAKLNFAFFQHVNWAGFREPGYLWSLDRPFIWGPIGGTENYPWRFLRRAGFRGAVIEGTRNIINAVQRRLSPRVRKAANAAAVVLTANTDGQRTMKEAYGVDSIVLPNNGIWSLVEHNASANHDDGTLRILWSSRHAHNKALHLLLEAAAKLPEGFDYEIRILGGGALEKRWRRMANRLEISDHCNWMGSLPHDQALAQFEWADVFAFTSLRDTCASVVLEALGNGVPVVCFDHSGGHDVVNDSCGVKIPVTTPDDAIVRLCDVLVSLQADRPRLSFLSGGAYERASEYLWSRNAEQMNAVYRQVLDRQPDGTGRAKDIGGRHTGSPA